MPEMELLLTPDAFGLASASLLLALLITLVTRRRRREGFAAQGREELTPPTAAPAVVAEAPAALAPPPPVSSAARFRAALAKSRSLFRQRLDEAFGQARTLEACVSALEEALVSADVGMRATSRILEEMQRRCANGSLKEEPEIRAILRAVIEESLGEPLEPERTVKPWVILVAGVNGVGKTTSIGKLAARFRGAGQQVLLVAADTFRAAAIDQLEIWARRAGADLVRHQSGADPAAVAFDGMQAAVARDVDVVIVDTAGRLHTRENLMEELRKVCRVIGKTVPGAPHEVLLVLDATTGQNALSQARVFTETLGVTGIILTKLDGTAKGGAALAVRQELGVPLLYVGLGEAEDDLRPFSARDYTAGLLGEDS